MVSLLILINFLVLTSVVSKETILGSISSSAEGTVYGSVTGNKSTVIDHAFTLNTK